MNLIEHILSAIAPHECLGCGKEGAVICYGCADALPRVAPRCYSCRRPSEEFRTCKICRNTVALERVLPFTAYKGQAKALIHELKFSRLRGAAEPIADMMANVIPRNIVITHVPTATTRVRQRGYDQSALIARALAAKTGGTYLSLLARMGQQRQLGSGRKARKAQIEGAFIAIATAPASILLVDDVVTTGATLEACALVLRNAGAKHIAAATFAAA